MAKYLKNMEPSGHTDLPYNCFDRHYYLLRAILIKWKVQRCADFVYLVNQIVGSFSTVKTAKWRQLLTLP